MVRIGRCITDGDDRVALRSASSRPGRVAGSRIPPVIDRPPRRPAGSSPGNGDPGRETCGERHDSCSPEPRPDKNPGRSGGMIRSGPTGPSDGDAIPEEPLVPVSPSTPRGRSTRLRDGRREDRSRPEGGERPRSPPSVASSTVASRTRPGGRSVGSGSTAAANRLGAPPRDRQHQGHQDGSHDEELGHDDDSTAGSPAELALAGGRPWPMPRLMAESSLERLTPFDSPPG
jgi:hypothetical protein